MKIHVYSTLYIVLATGTCIHVYTACTVHIEVLSLYTELYSTKFFEVHNFCRLVTSNHFVETIFAHQKFLSAYVLITHFRSFKNYVPGKFGATHYVSSLTAGGRPPMISRLPKCLEELIKRFS